MLNVHIVTFQISTHLKSSLVRNHNIKGHQHSLLQHFQMLFHKQPCCVARVLDIVDCPPHNHVHDIASYPKFYDPIYYPEIYPELFLNIHTVKQWLESSLSSHVLSCKICLRSNIVSQIKFSVFWQNFYYTVCSYLNGKFRQCALSLEELQSCKYSHCQLVSRLQYTHPSLTKIECTQTHQIFVIKMGQSYSPLTIL